MNKKFTSVELGGMYVTLVVAKVVFGHYTVWGISSMPVFFPILTLLICYTNVGSKLIHKSLLLSALFILHNQGVFMFAYGTHDDVGYAWILLFSLAGLLPSLAIYVLYALVSDEKWQQKLLSIVLVIIGMFLTLLDPDKLDVFFAI